MKVEIQWTEAGEPENWESFINANSYKDALIQLIGHVNDREAIADFFRVVVDEGLDENEEIDLNSTIQILGRPYQDV